MTNIKGFFEIPPPPPFILTPDLLNLRKMSDHPPPLRFLGT